MPGFLQAGGQSPVLQKSPGVAWSPVFPPAVPSMGLSGSSQASASQHACSTQAWDPVSHSASGASVLDPHRCQQESIPGQCGDLALRRE